MTAYEYVFKIEKERSKGSTSSLYTPLPLAARPPLPIPLALLKKCYCTTMVAIIEGWILQW